MGCVRESVGIPSEFVQNGDDQTIPKRGDATNDKQSIQFRVTGMEEHGEIG